MRVEAGKRGQVGRERLSESIEFVEVDLTVKKIKSQQFFRIHSHLLKANQILRSARESNAPAHVPRLIELC